MRHCLKYAFAVMVSGIGVQLLGADTPKFFDSNGVRVHFVDQGRGTPVLLIHGYTGSVGWWQKHGVVSSLENAGYRVVAFDNRGHGLSDKPHETAQYGMEMVADAQRLLNHLEIKKAHIVGYSMGAVIAEKFREQHADRALSVTLGGYGHPPLPDRYSVKLVQEIETNLRAMKLSKGNDAEALAHIALAWSAWTVVPKARKHQSPPTLALIGKNDVFLKDTQKLAKQLPSLKVKILPGDHQSLPKQPEFMTALLEHLRSSGTRKSEVVDR